jgi:hypothetical protein
MGGDREVVESNEILRVAHFKLLALVAERYTDRTKIAYSSDSWMYGVYHQQISSNFVGWGRSFNI